jgi:hypothetical protein
MAQMTMQLPVLLPSGHGEATAVYDAADPFAVRFGLWDSRLRMEVVWAISRDLLAEALTVGQAGAGDVRVTARGDLIVLGLSNQNGSVTAVFRRDDVTELLDRTHLIVWPGTESGFLDWSDTVEFPGVAL